MHLHINIALRASRGGDATPASPLLGGSEEPCLPRLPRRVLAVAIGLPACEAAQLCLSPCRHLCSSLARRDALLRREHGDGLRGGDNSELREGTA